MPEPISVLELLSDRSRWTRKANARDQSGCIVLVNDPHACKWCLMGACIKVYGEGSERRFPVERKLFEAGMKLFGRTIVFINDHLGYEAVIQVVKEAGV